MSLRLPRWESLSQDEQVPIINLPLDEDLWVTGGPGTGKTAMAIHRAYQVLQAAPGTSVVLMIYNRSLKLYVRQALKETAVKAIATTWHSWLYRRYHATHRQDVPETGPYTPNWEIVTPQMVEHFERQGPAIDHLVLDEAQDLPTGLLKILRRAAKVISVFSDPNQRIHAAATDHDGIGRELRVATRRYRLTRNYRNSREIAAVAEPFRSGPANEAPTPPTRSGPRPEAVEADDVEQALDHIALHANNHPEKHVGVLVPDYELHQAVKQILRPKLKGASLQIYRNDDKRFTFETCGIKLLTYDTAKGLEFDTVILPLLGAEQRIEDPDAATRNRLYVACSRAREELIFLHTPQTRAWAIGTLVDHDTAIDWFTLRDDPADALNF
jgi:DNA helicase IV